MNQKFINEQPLGYIPPTNAQDLLVRYHKGERYFVGAHLGECDLSNSQLEYVNLDGAFLEHANLAKSNLSQASLIGAFLRSADLSDAIYKDCFMLGANLDGALLENTNLFRSNLCNTSFVKAYLKNANLTGSILENTNFNSAFLEGAIFNSVKLRSTVLTDINLGPFARAEHVRHWDPSIIDHRSILRSLREPTETIKNFLSEAGISNIFIEYMYDCALSLDEFQLFSMLHSTFISYGEPDKAFAEILSNKLRQNGVNTFYFPIDSIPG